MPIWHNCYWRPLSDGAVSHAPSAWQPCFGHPYFNIAYFALWCLEINNYFNLFLNAKSGERYFFKVCCEWRKKCVKSIVEDMWSWLQITCISIQVPVTCTCIILCYMYNLEKLLNILFQKYLLYFRWRFLNSDLQKYLPLEDRIIKNQIKNRRFIMLLFNLNCLRDE